MRPDTRQSFLLTFLLIVAGCGTTQMRTGTEQLLLSDSVDRTVDKLDFAVLAGRKVFLDTTYIQPVKGVLFVNSGYIVSALRHKLTTSGCLIRGKQVGSRLRSGSSRWRAWHRFAGSYLRAAGQHRDQ